MNPKTRNIIIVIVIVGAVLAWIVSDKSPSTPQPAQTTKCQSASASQIEAIQSGIQSVQASNSIKTAFVVKSPDYNNVYFVAAKIYGPNMENGEGPGLWAMGGTPDQPATIMSVNAFATSFTNYPDGSKTDAKLSQFDAGGQEAIECAK